jgi:hypothetical protein
MIDLVKRRAGGDSVEVTVLGAIRYVRVGLISVVSVLGREIYHRIDSRRCLFGVVWDRHAA